MNTYLFNFVRTIFTKLNVMTLLNVVRAITFTMVCHGYLPKTNPTTEQITNVCWSPVT